MRPSTLPYAVEMVDIMLSKIDPAVFGKLVEKKRFSLFLVKGKTSTAFQSIVDFTIQQSFFWKDGRGMHLSQFRV